jgi:hypothetical protein
MQAASVVSPLLSKSMQAASSMRPSHLTIDARCIDGADAASTLDAALIDRDRQRLGVDAGCIERETTRSPRESICHRHRRGRHRFRVLSRPS